MDDMCDKRDTTVAPRGATARRDRAPFTADVIVVGAGVAGCACAAALAESGARVTVVSSALDVTGLPGYGPEVVAPSGRWEDIDAVFRRLPRPLAVAWLSAASVAEDETPLLVVDRRAVSIETKRLLELIPGLEFRQGHVMDVRLAMSGGSRRLNEIVEVETTFGEVLTARAAVLAVGLALGGSLTIGGVEVAGGWYGEVPAAGLREALQAAGASFKEAERRVGARYGHAESITQRDLAPADAGSALCGTFRLLPLRTSVQDEEGGELADGRGLPPSRAETQGRLSYSDVRRGLRELITSRPDLGWSAEYPPAPHVVEMPSPSAVAVASFAKSTDAATGGRGRPSGEVEPGEHRPVTTMKGRRSRLLLIPDGLETGESYVSEVSALGSADAEQDLLDMMVSPSDSVASMPVAGISAAAVTGRTGKVALGPPTRLGYVARASYLTGLDRGRLPQFAHHVWATGHVAGADGYLECLTSGLDVAAAVIESLDMSDSSRARGALRDGDDEVAGAKEVRPCGPEG